MRGRSSIEFTSNLHYTEDVEEPLTPSHLVSGKRLLTLPHIRESSEIPESTRVIITKRAQYQRNLVDHFWKRWRREYLVDLGEHHRLVASKQKTQPVRVGDVVVVHEDNVRRNQWRLGKIESLIIGRGGVVRGAVVKLGERNRKSSMIERPIGKLYPLELN